MRWQLGSVFALLVASSQLVHRMDCFSVRQLVLVRRIKNGLFAPSLACRQLQDDSNYRMQQESNVETLYEFVCRHTALALRHSSDDRGLKSLETLAELCQNRIPYEFDSSESMPDNDRFVQHIPQFLSESITNELTRRVDYMTRQGWLSTNADSVDGLPSFHLNLISEGKPVVSRDDAEQATDNDFHDNLRSMINLVQPHIEDKLLPAAQKLIGTPSLRVQDAFLRRYGDDVVNGQSRNGISAHYDVYSHMTAVCALDNTAAQGTNGLYTTALYETNDSSIGSTTNHAALRRFFPLRQGDVVLHSWNVLHGVDVQGDLTRTSLIVWFTSDGKMNNDVLLSQNSCAFDAPWLLDRNDLDTNDVAQFVLASAVESSSTSEEARRESHSQAITKEHSMSATDFYFRSAAKGNAFALTRLGSLCEEGVVGPVMAKQISELLDQLQDGHADIHAAVKCDQSSTVLNLAKRCWLEGALRGNPLAQSSLADELMLEGTNQDVVSKRLLAATLFGLKAQQGHEASMDALRRLLHYEAGRGGEINLGKAIRIAEAACCCLP